MTKPPPDSTATELSLTDLLEEHARSYPEKIAVADGGLRLTYPELARRVRHLAQALDRHGVSRGDRIAWFGQNSFRILEGMLACARLGAIFCPVNWRQSAEEMAFVLDDLEPAVVIWQQEEVGTAVEHARAAARHRPALWLQHDTDGDGSYESVLARAGDDADHRQSPTGTGEPVLALYTAAFEGRPNAALLSQRAFLAQSPVVAMVTDFVDKTVFLNSGPLFHIGTMKFMMACFFVGGTNVFIRRSDPQALCEVIHRERCTTAFLVTKTMREMAALNRDGRYDLGSLHSQPVAPEWDAMVHVVQPPGNFDRSAGYGQTEVCGYALWQFFGGRSLGLHGRPSPVAQVRLLDDEGHEVPRGNVGEFAIGGPLVMNGYWRRPELNAARRCGAWHRCNDLGRQEADGSYTFIGPKTQMIKSGVENIYPAEVENCLKAHPAVADCGVIGIPDAQWIQSVKAIVALTPEVAATEAELIEHCRRHIGSYKKPRSIAFVDHIPRNGGAVDYRALDAAFGGGNYPGGTTPNK